MDFGGPKELSIRWGPDSPCDGAVIRGKDMLEHVRQHSAVSCAKMAGPIDLPFVDLGGLICIHLIYGSLSPSEPTTKMVSRSVQLFLQSSWQNVIGRAQHVLSHKSFPFTWGIWTPFNTCFLGPTRVHNPNGISVG